MSEFRRTLNGINNEDLFLDVEHIVYVEGGSKSFSKEQVLSGDCNNDTEDIHFWRNVFLKLKPKNKFKFKSVGSKTTLLEFAKDIVGGKLTTIYLGMDCEFDEILNKKIKGDKIFYTRGYSYENDVWNENLIISLLEDISASNIQKESIIDGFKKFIKDITIAVRFDAYLFSKQNSFFKKKGGTLTFINISKDFPIVDPERIQNVIDLLGISLKTVTNYSYRKKICTKRYCYGHLLADYSCQVIMHYLNKYHGLKGLQKEVLYRMAIAKYFKEHFKNNEIYQHYEEQFA